MFDGGFSNLALNAFEGDFYVWKESFNSLSSTSRWRRHTFMFGGRALTLSAQPAADSVIYMTLQMDSMSHKKSIKTEKYYIQAVRFTQK